MTDRELMQQALNVLKIFVDGGNSAWARKIIEIKEALRDRLAQPEEPDWSAAGFSKPPKQQDRQCPSCGGFCKPSGCERENVQPEQEHSEAWWKHEVSNAWAEGYEKGRLQREWQGLTDEEVRDLWSWSMTAEAERTANTQQHAFARAIEAKLKEKNNAN